MTSKGKALGGFTYSTTDPKHKDYWATPEWAVKGLAEYLHQSGEIRANEFTLDVCASEHNAKAPFYINEEMDTLVAEWGKNEVCWLNPPYSNVQPFLEKAVTEAENGNQTVALLKNDCSTKWFRYAVDHAAMVIFITDGRIGFVSALTGESVGGNNFSSVAFLFKKRTAGLKTVYLSKSYIKELGGEDGVQAE